MTLEQSGIYQDGEPKALDAGGRQKLLHGLEGVLSTSALAGLT